MSCIPQKQMTYKPQLHVIVEQPINALNLGRVQCIPVGNDDVRGFEFDWKGPPGCSIQLDNTGSEAYGLIPGKYVIHVTDREMKTSVVNVTISPVMVDAIVVKTYITQPSSSGSASDGQIEAVGDGLDKWNRYLWSNGMETQTPVLKDIRPGYYFLTAGSVGGKVPIFIQQCMPGQVTTVGLKDPRGITQRIARAETPETRRTDKTGGGPKLTKIVDDSRRSWMP